MPKKWKGIAAIAVALALCLVCFGCSESETSSNASESTESSSASENSSASSSASESSSSSDSEATESAIADKYVTADWLKDHMDEVVIVDTRSADSFDSSHIAGAVNLHWQSVSNVSVDQGSEGWGELLDPNDIVAAAATIGIDGTKPVVLYTDINDGWGEDGRIYWTLREAGIDDVHILDGGWSQWIAADGSIVTTLRAGEDTDPIAQVDTAYVKEHMGSAVIIDARSEAEYDGETTMGEARAGHIPGAINIPYVSLFSEDGKLLPEDDLKKILDEAGIKTTDEIIVYCTGGVRAAAVAEILSDLGYDNVSVYTAGYSEWAGDESNEIEGAPTETEDASDEAAQ